VRLAVALLVATACVAGSEEVEPPSPVTLIRPGADPLISRTGDLDGDRSPELVVASISEAPSAFGLATPYLEVFASREGEWRRVFDATGHAPPGEGTPGVMLQPAEEGFAVGQKVDVLELVDFEGAGSSRIVAAISNVGATVGPLELWVISMNDADELLTEHYFRTERGGSVSIEANSITLQFGVYRRKDPGCCPSILETRTIGYDPRSDAIVTLQRQRERLQAR